MENGIFNNLRNLEELKLYNNQLVELDKDLFKDLQSLEYFHVGFNEQVKFKADHVIMYLQALNKIHLDDRLVIKRGGNRKTRVE